MWPASEKLLLFPTQAPAEGVKLVVLLTRPGRTLPRWPTTILERPWAVRGPLLNL